MSESSSDNLTPAPGAAYDSIQLDKVASAVARFTHPSQIGQYHILEVIGQGGMGTVYRAEQREPIQRMVALKVIKIGMDTEQVIARFDSERQAVALMNHANVARVLDAGATDTGRPYFVMEFVQGEPITVFADRYRLTVKERLALLLQACDAVEHAHQKGIIHRDLKPSNILVTKQDAGGPGIVKVIDFGVAKAISLQKTERTLFTETGQLIGTPEYMSPEQAGADGDDIDTRTDVYGLGVVLYELLSGGLPFEPESLRSGGYSEIQRIIREVDPPRPSTRLSRLGPAAQAVAHHRQLALPALEKQLKSEVEWIPLKAMRKEREERYASASALGDDLRNYLNNRPLRAGPASLGYRAKKFLRRNKRAVIAAALVMLALVGGAIGTTWQAVRATRANAHLVLALDDVKQKNQEIQRTLETVRRQKKQVEDASVNVRTINEFLTDDVLQSADPSITRGDNLTMRQALDSASLSVSRKFKDQPLSEASVRYTLALTYDALGRADLGLAHAKRSLELRRKLLGNDDPLTIASMNALAILYLSQSRLDDAGPLCEEALRRARPLLNDNPQLLLNALSNSAQLQQVRGKYTDADKPSREAMEIARNRLGNDQGATLAAINNYANLLMLENRAADAEPLLRELVATHRRLFGDDFPNTLTAIANLAKALAALGNFDEAGRLHREVLATMSRVLGDEHPNTLLELRSFGSMLEDQQRYEEAADLYARALKSSRKTLGEDHADTLGAMNHLASVLQKLGRVDDAIKLNREVLARCRKTLGDDHPDTLFTLNNLGMTLAGDGKNDEAEPLFAELYRRAPKSQLDAATIAYCMSRWGPCLAQLNRDADAEVPLLEAHRRLVENKLQTSAPMKNVLTALIKVCEETNRKQEAEKWRAELAAIMSSGPPGPSSSAMR